MGRQIDMDKPLSTEDEQWLRDRSRGWQVDENKRRLADQAKARGEDVPEEVPYVHPYTVADEPFEPGGDDPRRVPFPLVDTPQAVAYDPNVPDNEQQVISIPGEEVEPEPQEPAVNIDDLHVEDLKDELRARGISTTGNKEALQDRLKEAVAKEG